MDTHFDEVMTKVDEMLKDKQIELNEIIGILAPTMEFVERCAEPGITGKDKRDFVIHVLKSVVERSTLDDNKKNLILSGCDTIIPPMIDTIISATRGEFELNISPEMVTGCFVCFQSIAATASSQKRLKNKK